MEIGATVAVIGIALAALLVGTLIPLIVQARTVLRSVQKLVDEAGPKVNQTLDEARAATARLNQMAITVEPAAPRVAELAEALGGATDALRRVQTGLNMAAAIGPAIAAAVKAYQAVTAARRSEAAADDSDDFEPDTNDSPAAAVPATKGERR